jgi:hypothetical protein
VLLDDECSVIIIIIINKKQNLWTESACKLYRPSDRRLLAKLVPTFADRGVSGLLDRSRDFFPKWLLNCTHEAGWTPFQTHYFSENLVAPGIELGPLDL